MHSGVLESNEVRVTSSAASSSSSHMNHSLFTSLFAPVHDVDENLVEKKRKMDGVGAEEEGLTEREKAVPFPSLFAEPPSMYFVPGYRPGGGGEGETGFTGEQGIVPAVAPFPMLTPQQQGFVRFGTELSPIFPGSNNSWSPQPVGNPYQSCFPYNSMCIPSVLPPNLKPKVEESYNLQNPPQMENLFGHIPVLHAGFVPFQGMFQNPFLSASVMAPFSNHSLSSLLSKNQEHDPCATSRGPRDDYPFVPKPVRGPLLNFSPSASLTKTEELNVCATSQGPGDGDPLDGSAPVSSHKRKLGSPSYSSNTSLTASMEGNNKASLEHSSKHAVPLWLENSAEASQNIRPSPVSTSAEPQPRYPSSATSNGPEEEKETKGKDWELLVQKELRNTDVGNLGRIVLPKKDAEANLPQLVAKDGLILQMEDMTFSINWRFKYRYWPNNKSRMYVMENTGDFVRTHNLQTGDFFIVYKEKNSGKYIACGKKGKKASPCTADDGRTEEGEAQAKGFTPKSFSSANGNTDLRSKNSAFVRMEPFDFEGNSSGSSRFIEPL